MTCATSHLALYAAVGSELTHYADNVAAGTLTRRGAVTLPANVQYGWPHASGQRLYVGCSDSPTGRGSFLGGNHSLTALAIDTASGALPKVDDSVTGAENWHAGSASRRLTTVSARATSISTRASPGFMSCSKRRAGWRCLPWTRRRCARSVSGTRWSARARAARVRPRAPCTSIPRAERSTSRIAHPRRPASGAAG